MRAAVLAAERVLCAPDLWIEDGGLFVEEGRVRRLLRSRGAVRRAVSTGARLVEVDGLLAPGLVNAHAHLELTGLEGRLPRGRPLPQWIGALLGMRSKRSPEELRTDVLRGADRLLAGGTTTVGDIDSTGATTHVGGRFPMRARLYREVLDAADPARTAATLDGVRRALPARRRVSEGLAPHAPYTVSDELLRGVARLARRRRVPVTIHWAETEEELEWERAGTGPFARVLEHRVAGSGLERLAACGLLGPSTSLVHANHPRAGEIERVAASGATVVHCPGAHAWFERAPFPLEAWLDAGVAVALGTDSLAGNDDLSMLRETALLRGAHPGLDPARAWSMATTEAARATGLGGLVGELSPGAWADCCLYACGGGRARALEELTSGALAPEAVWIGGRRLWTGESGPGPGA